MSGTRYTDTIDLTGAAVLAPGEVRVVDNPTLREPDIIIAKRETGDANVVIDQITTTSPFTMRVTNPGTLPNESVLSVGFRHSIIK